MNNRPAPCDCLQPARDHDFGPPRKYAAITGPMSGTWTVRDCLRCAAAELVSAEDPAGSLGHILGALAALGCDPRPAAAP